MRLQRLERQVRALYEARCSGRADWADWLYANHVFVVAELADVLAQSLESDPELPVAASMLHDIADSICKRENPEHASFSSAIASTLCVLSEYGEAEGEIIIAAVGAHSCRNGAGHCDLTAKILATADAEAHLQTNFYEFAIGRKLLSEPPDVVARWAAEKVRRDFCTKIQFDDVRDRCRKRFEFLIDLVKNL